MVMYALHDALVKPMPGGLMTPSLAESWTEAKDHLSYTFVLRKGVRFHNGDPLTAEDVKFSWDRYKGASATLLKSKIKDVEIVNPGTVRFVLREPWPDFITFYGTTASGAGWIVPRSTWKRSATTASRPRRWGRAPTRSSRSSRASSWCSRRSTATGARRPR